MAEGRIGVGPRVAATLMATVALTGVVAASGGAFDSPSPTTTTSSAPTTAPTTSTTHAKDLPSAQVLAMCFGSGTKRSPEATVRIEPLGKNDEADGLVKITVDRTPISGGCESGVVFCATGRTPDASSQVPSDVVEGSGKFELENQQPSPDAGKGDPQAPDLLKLSVRRSSQDPSQADWILTEVRPESCSRSASNSGTKKQPESEGTTGSSTTASPRVAVPPVVRTEDPQPPQPVGPAPKTAQNSPASAENGTTADQPDREP